MALSRVVSEIFNVEKCRDLEIEVKGHSRSLKVYQVFFFRKLKYYWLIVCKNYSSDFRKIGWKGGT